MYSDTRNEASESYLLASIHPPSVSGTSRPSSSQDGASRLTSDINSSGAVDTDAVSLVARDHLVHLTLTCTEQINTSDADTERSRKLKGLPTCEVVKDAGHKTLEHWSKSFELADQEYLLEDLEPLDALKRETNNDFIQGQFEVLVTFSAAVKSCFKDFQALRMPLDDLASREHTTVAQQVEALIKLRSELKKNAASFIKKADIFFSGEKNVHKFQDNSVKKARKKLDSLLFGEKDRHEDAQWSIDMYKDGERMAPKIKVDPSGLSTTFLEGIGKYAFSKRSKKHKCKLVGSKLMQDVYQEERSKTEHLNRKLTESKNSLREAHSAWMCLRQPIYNDMMIVIQETIPDGTNGSCTVIVNKLDEAEGKLLTLIEMIDELLAQITQEYGLKFSTRQVKRLCSRLPNICTALEMLLSAKEVVSGDYKHIYEEHIYALCNAILEYLKIMREIHSWELDSTINVERQASFLREDLPRFRNDVEPHLQGITDIVEAHISKSKSKEAFNKREKQDGYYENSTLTRDERPLVNKDEILWALHKVSDAIVLIQTVSSAKAESDINAEENGDCREEIAANNSLPQIKMPDKMITQVYQALFTEVQKLEDLKDNVEERLANARASCNEEPEQGGWNFPPFRRLFARKPH